MTKIDLEQLMSVLKGLGIVDEEQADKLYITLNTDDNDPEEEPENKSDTNGEFIINKNKVKKSGGSKKLKKVKNGFDAFIKNLNKNITASEKSELERAAKFDRENPTQIKSSRRKFEKITVTCRCCHKTESVSPMLCSKDSDGSIKYKCNNCSTKVCE